ncbi:hypothetical protein BKA80DRAFT_275848 [Phyllosticta citrichinensis]
MSIGLSAGPSVSQSVSQSVIQSRATWLARNAACGGAPWRRTRIHAYTAYVCMYVCMHISTTLRSNTF